MIKQALILAGGIGSRLGDLTMQTPKPVLEVAGRPFLAYLIWNLKRQGITHVVLSVGYLADTLMQIVGNGDEYGLNITYSVETERLGTGGGVRLAQDHLDDVFLILNGDTLFDFNYLDLSLHLSDDCLGAVALRRVGDVSRYGSVRLEGGKIRTFGEKTQRGAGIINGGVYLLRKMVLGLDWFPDGPNSIEYDLFPKLAESGRLAGFVYDGFFLDIGLPETLEAAQTELPVWQRKLRAFSDCAKILNVDNGCAQKPEDVD